MFYNTLLIILLVFPGWDLIELCDIIALTFNGYQRQNQNVAIKKSISPYCIIPLFVYSVLYSCNEFLKCRQNSTVTYCSLLHLQIQQMRAPFLQADLGSKYTETSSLALKLPQSSSNPGHGIGHQQVMAHTATDYPSKRSVKTLETMSYGVNNRANSILIRSWEQHLAYFPHSLNSQFHILNKSLN